MRPETCRGITLIEMLVVLTIIALVAGITGPALGRRIDTITLQSTATELAAQLRRAQAFARAEQVPVAMTYSDHLFTFWKESKAVATYRLPVTISPAIQKLPTFIFLPSGQILGADTVKLQNDKGRTIAIKTDLLSGITIDLAAAS